MGSNQTRPMTSIALAILLYFLVGAIAHPVKDWENALRGIAGQPAAIAALPPAMPYFLETDLEVRGDLIEEYREERDLDREILDLRKQGMSYKAIQKATGLSYRQVRKVCA